MAFREDPRLIVKMSRRALCHEWFTTYGGADQVAARLARALGITDVFSYAARDSTARQLFPEGTLQAIGPSTAAFHWQWFLPHMPVAWKSLDLSKYELVVTSAHSCVNAVRPSSDAILVSYCHTPMRYAWEWRSESSRFPVLVRPLLPAIAGLFRAADRSWAQRVDLFLANSRFVAGRIAAAYGKPSLVVYPPIDTGYWTPAGSTESDDFFLLSGRLVAYKRPQVVVAAAQEAGVRLVVAGDGPMLPRLRKMAGAGVRFVVSPARDELRELYRRARGYVFAGVEDFGMSIVEAQACGTPVIALRAGGALETVDPGRTGILVEDPASSAFAEALRRFDPDDYDDNTVRDLALRFDAQRFDATVRWAVERALARDWRALAGHPDWIGSAPARRA